LTANAFGRENTGVVYGWIGAAHQLGASLAALTAGTLRTVMGNYSPSFWGIGLLCFLTGFVFLFCRSALERSAVMPVPQMVEA
jgi:nitrate/nitrite transporter NarK